MNAQTAWLDAIAWDEKGLVPVIAQEMITGTILMVAWMNREALTHTFETGEAVYWSRSRGRLWRKGEDSGNVQKVREIRLDCDNDVVLVRVDQIGGIACHTGRQNCFFQKLETTDGGTAWVVTAPVLRDPKEMYGKREK